MLTKTTSRLILLSFALAGFILLSGSSFAQQKSDEQAKGKKTITIHVTKEVDGNVVVIDTTVVTDGDFDADAFLAEKGIDSNIPENKRRVEKNVIIRHPGTKEFEWTESDGNLPDTIRLDNSEMFVYNDDFDIDIDVPSPPDMEDLPFHHYKFNNHAEMPYFNEHQMEIMIEGMARSFGLEDVMPFGEMKQMVVKKKRNGKKVIITFEDRDETDMERKQENEERVIILKDDDGNGSQVEKHIIIKGKPGEKVIIKEGKNAETNEVEVTVDVDTDKAAPAKTEKKVIIIKEEKKK